MEGSKYWNYLGHLGKCWLIVPGDWTPVPAHLASASVVVDTMHFSLVLQFSGCSLNPVSLWKTVQWKEPNNHMNRYVHAWESCNQTQHKSQMGQILMYSPIFCASGYAQQGCKWVGLLAQSQVPRVQPNFTTAFLNSLFNLMRDDYS